MLSVNKPGIMGLKPTNAVPLREDSVGVSTEDVPRSIQVNGEKYRKVTLNRDWLEQLNIAELGSQTVHSVSLAVNPVVVQHPAIIIQPASVIGEVDE